MSRFPSRCHPSSWRKGKPTHTYCCLLQPLERLRPWAARNFCLWSTQIVNVNSAAQHCAAPATPQCLMSSYVMLLLILLDQGRRHKNNFLYLIFSIISHITILDLTWQYLTIPRNFSGMKNLNFLKY